MCSGLLPCGQLGSAAQEQLLAWAELAISKLDAILRPVVTVQALLIGGAGQEGPLKDTWLLDLGEERWVRYQCANQAPTCWHAACVAASNNVRILMCS